MTIQTDVTNDNTSMSIDEASNAFLEGWKDPTEVSKDTKGAKSESEETVAEDELEEENTEETVEDEGSEEDPTASEDDEGTEEKPKAAKVAEDDAEVTVTVDGVEQKVSVKDLKRLAGQEAALTRKSQEVAAHRKELEETRNLHVSALQNLVKRAEDAYKPYAEIDYLVASKEMSTEDFQAVRAAAAEAYSNYQFLTQELGGAMQQQTAAEEADFRERAQNTIRVLSDPNTGIKGWNQQVYNEVRDYAVSTGMAPDIVNRITDPAALRVLHKAMAFDKIKTVVTVKKAAAPKKVLSSSSNSQGSVTAKSGISQKTAMATLRARGDRDSAANAFLAGWASNAEAE